MMKQNKNNLKFFLIGLITTLLANCADNKNKASLEHLTPERLYERAINSTKKHDFSAAIKDFSLISQEHPYSKLSVKSQIMEAYTYYLMRDYDMAIAITDNFVKYHPGYKDLAYAYYLKALSYYEQIEDVSRDQKNTELAAISFRELISRFPGSEYARDAKIKLELVLDHLAGKEMEIGRFYIHKGEIIAAINHFRNVVEQYQTTTHVAEALYRLSEAYMTLGLYDEAQKNSSVLGHNYPESKWYHYSYTLLKDKKRIINKEQNATQSAN